MAETILSLPTLEVQALSLDGASTKIGRVWLNRPSSRNALSSQALQDIVDAFTFLQTQYNIPVVILAGRGKSFCAGADMRDPPGFVPADEDTKRTVSGRERRHVVQLGRRAIAAVENLEAVTIAQAHGHAMGGGFGLMQACDLRLCTSSTRLSLPEVNIMVPLTWGLTARLVRDVGRAKAMELIALCEDLPPAKAEMLGLVNHVLADEIQLEEFAMKWATKLASQHEVALHMMKTQFRALSRTMDMGDVTEGDNDLLLLAPAMRARAKL